jgi:hypothetical protein
MIFLKYVLVIMQYNPLTEVDSTPRGSIVSLDPINNDHHVGMDRIDNLCRTCRNKILRKQPVDHTPTECLNQRCESLEGEIMRLKDHDTKSRLHVKELESKFTALETAIKGLAIPKQEQAAPFNFGPGHRFRNPLKKSYSVQVPSQHPEINYDHILPPKRSDDRDRVGLFGSLGASSQR